MKDAVEKCDGQENVYKIYKMAECTIYDKLRYIAETKDLIKSAIEAQDVEVLESATFRQYAEYLYIYKEL